MSETPSTTRRRRAGWKTPALAILAVANAALLASLLGTGLDAASPARAQNAQSAQADGQTSINAAQAGRPSEYLMLPARLTNLGQDIVYIIDTQSGDLTAVAYDRQNGMQFIQPVRLSQAFNNAGR